ncbi:MAG: SLC13 family permease [Alphaproteobacteria bacterium]
MVETEMTFQIFATFAVIVVALTLYVIERIPMELVSLAVIAVLLVLFHFFPVSGPDGVNRLAAVHLLAGFANPALITVLSLLVIGQGLVRTGVLDQVAQAVFHIGGGSWLALVLALVIVAAVSAFLNNIPVVVIFIPIMQALAQRLNRPTSGLMMPLSYAAILGGMTTLIGSSTNLLVSSALVEVGVAPFAFFDFTVPGLVLAGFGLCYVLGVVPRLLPVRVPQGDDVAAEGGGRQFVAQISISETSKLVGATAVAGLFRSLPDITVRLIQRGGERILPPFEDVTLQPRDVLVVAATRKALTDTLRDDPGQLRRDSGREESDRRATSEVLAEAMITPTSRLIGQTLDQVRGQDTRHCTVIGVRRRLRMLRAQLTQIRLEAGDVLLVQGRPDDVGALRFDPDVVLMEWSATDLPSPHHAPRAGLIFLAVVVCAASGLLPIAVAAVGGATLMVAAGVLNARQAAETLDRKLVMTIAAALALGVALQETGGADLLADALLHALDEAHPAIVLSVFFLLVAVLSNIISTKACAVLFTPIAVGIAHGLGVDPTAFAVAVVFAANCSFASPIGYQTNLLVITPGNYRFVDFVRAGSPLIVLLWAVFSLFAPWYFGLL